jgi:hypothetical protein
MTTTTVTQATSVDIDHQLGRTDRLLGRMAHLLDAAKHPAVHIRACIDPSIQIHWGTYTEWVRGCDWLSDTGADMTTREAGGGDGSDVLLIADATVDGIDVTFSGSKRQA